MKLPGSIDGEGIAHQLTTPLTEDAIDSLIRVYGKKTVLAWFPSYRAMIRASKARIITDAKYKRRMEGRR